MREFSDFLSHFAHDSILDSMEIFEMKGLRILWRGPSDWGRTALRVKDRAEKEGTSPSATVCAEGKYLKMNLADRVKQEESRVLSRG